MSTIYPTAPGAAGADGGNGNSNGGDVSAASRAPGAGLAGRWWLGAFAVGVVGCWVLVRRLADEMRGREAAAAQLQLMRREMQQREARLGAELSARRREIVALKQAEAATQQENRVLAADLQALRAQRLGTAPAAGHPDLLQPPAPPLPGRRES